MTDESLMLACKQEPRAFEELYRRHKRTVFAFIRRMCRQQELAEDLSQDVWVSVARAAADYEVTGARFTTWLLRIASNKVLDHFRHVNVKDDEGNRIGEREQTFGDLPPEAVIHATAAEVDEPLRQLESREIMRAIDDALARLSLVKRQAVELHFLEFSREEIAAITGADPETVKARLRYAWEELRRNPRLRDLR